MTKRFLIVAFLISTTRMLAAQTAGDGGTVRGVVLNEAGKPVAEAIVFIQPAPAPGMMAVGILRTANTGEDGQYTFDALKWGSYRVYAMKESDGYPDPYFDFWGPGLTYSPRLSSDNRTVTVTLVIGPKAASISGTISDSETGKTLDASIHLWRVKKPEYSVTAGIRASYRVLIPPDVEVDFEIQARGYRPWRYSVDGPLGNRGALAAKSGDVVTLDVKLQRDAEKQ